MAKAKRHAKQTALDAGTTAVPATPAARLSGRPRLLLIEPNAQLARQMYAALRAQFEVTVVRSAQAAVSAADKYRPDLVVTELQTPDASISGFLHEFRSYAEWKSIPVVLYTFSLQLPGPLKKILKERFNVALILHKSHVTAAALRDHLQKIAVQSNVPA